jgi:hypothetical protein
MRWEEPLTPLGPSLNLRLGMFNLGTLEVFHQSGAERRETFSCRVSWWRRVGMSAVRNDVSIA